MANLTIDHIEEKTLSSFSPRPKLFLRYVDDHFCAMKTSEIENFRQHPNSMRPAIQFTSECKGDRYRPFLDVQVARKCNCLEFSVHKKPTHAGRYLQYGSSHPTCHKVSVVTTLLQRAKTICSNDTERKKEETRVVLDLIENGYPKNVIRAATRHAAKQRIQKFLSALIGSPPKCVPVPYVEIISEMFARIFKKTKGLHRARAFVYAGLPPLLP
ncbi:uncharacterized protein LOC142767051 [Rhipicephalus microplus]|uniref:uncharacterized protein LOC142767051 n=1 Tax=Rhipicephalus microplus TaxID=6941 RepID=UPI003F6A53CD